MPSLNGSIKMLASGALFSLFAKIGIDYEETKLLLLNNPNLAFIHRQLLASVPKVDGVNGAKAAREGFIGYGGGEGSG